MDYPLSKAAELRLIGGRFADRDPATNTPGSIVPAADWANPVTDEILAVIAEGGLAPDEAVFTQLRDAILNIIAANPSVPRGHIDGLILSNNGASPNTHIDLAAGIARAADDQFDLALAAGLTKNLNAAWAIGDGNGGLFSGAALAALTWYHLHLIRRDSDGAVDMGADTSVTAVNRPAGWSAWRRIGAVATDAAASIVVFRQHGDQFYWNAPISDYNAGGTTVRTLRTLSVPTGLKVRPIHLHSYGITANATFYTIVTDPDLADVAPGAAAHTGENTGTTGGQSSSAFIRCMTNAAAQIGTRQTNGSAIKGVTFGWIDPRGKDT